jgi:Ni,Fe-hydrogenase I small subunit
MRITRREFFKYCTIAAGALGLTSTDLLKLKDVLAKPSAKPVIWLQGASCTGDSTSLLNSIFYTDPVGLLISNSDSAAINLKFHQTVMNAAGSDLIAPVAGAGAFGDAIDAAQSVLSGSAGADTYAIWSSETWSGGNESIKMKIAHRNDNTLVAYAEITPDEPIVINEFNINFKFKTGETQAPFVELDIENQDTGATTTLISMYPEVWDNTTADGDPKDGRWEPITGPTDWRSVTLTNLPYWQNAGLNAPPPGQVAAPGEDVVTGQPNTWVNNTFYDVGNVVMATTAPNLLWFQCITAGTSAPLLANEPTWPTDAGLTVTDGTVLWRAISPNPGLIDVTPWIKWYDLRDQFGTWHVEKVRILDQGDSGVWGLTENATDYTQSCTMYVDDIWINGISYKDESEAITLYPGVGSEGTGFVLCVEGSVVTGRATGSLATDPDGLYCETGPMVPGSEDETMLNAFLTYAAQADAVIAIGTCASFGGIPKLGNIAINGKTGAFGCAQVLKTHGIKTPVINVPGCPAHPDWIVGTIVAFLVRGLDGINVDSNLRPLDFYGGYVCNGNEGQIACIPDDNACPWRYNNDGFDNSQYPNMVRGSDNVADDPTVTYGIGESRGLAKYKWGSVGAGEEYWDVSTGSIPYGTGHMFEGCLGVLGCRGRKTHADCAYRKWNAMSTLIPSSRGVNWCVGSRGGCQGCTEPDFPTLKRFYTFV